MSKQTAMEKRTQTLIAEMEAKVQAEKSQNRFKGMTKTELGQAFNECMLYSKN